VGLDDNFRFLSVLAGGGRPPAVDKVSQESAGTFFVAGEVGDTERHLTTADIPQRKPYQLPELLGRRDFLPSGLQSIFSNSNNLIDQLGSIASQAQLARRQHEDDPTFFLKWHELNFFLG
jgi:hypothetical protein